MGKQYQTWPTAAGTLNILDREMKMTWAMRDVSSS